MYAVSLETGIMLDVLRFQMNMIVLGRQSVCYRADACLHHDADQSEFNKMACTLREQQETNY
jgi:hypothetical protein